jgi:hypothetical protein
MLNGLMKILALGVLAIGVPFTTLAMAHKVCPPGNPFCTESQKVYHSCCKSGHRHTRGGMGEAYCVQNDFGPACEYGTLGSSKRANRDKR